jgi:hypothetical protein
VTSYGEILAATLTESVAVAERSAVARERIRVAVDWIALAGAIVAEVAELVPEAEPELVVGLERLRDAIEALASTNEVVAARAELDLTAVRERLDAAERDL